MNAKIEFENLEEVQKEMQELLKKDKKAVFQGMVKTGFQIHGEAKRLCPVDTANLRVHLAIEKDPAKMEVRVGTNVKYAPFVEFGTRPHTPPFSVIEDWVRRKKLLPKGALLARASKMKKDKVIRAIAGAIWTSIRKNGVKPHPFLRPAFANNIKNLVPNVKRFLR